MLNMKDIKRWFEYNYRDYDFKEYKGHLEVKTNTVLFLIVEPHDGTEGKWMLRATTISAFDRWVNSTAVQEFFDTSFELCDYLNEHHLDIYKELLEYLSKEYDEING